MYTQLKKEIVLWLLENENRWQRVNSCTEQFRDYIYNNEGNLFAVSLLILWIKESMGLRAS